MAGNGDSSSASRPLASDASSRRSASNQTALAGNRIGPLTRNLPPSTSGFGSVDGQVAGSQPAGAGPKSPGKMCACESMIGMSVFSLARQSPGMIATWMPSSPGTSPASSWIACSTLSRPNLCVCILCSGNLSDSISLIAFSVDAAGYENAVKVIESDKFPLHKMQTHKFGLDNVEHAIQLLAGEVPGEDGIHVAIMPGL